MPLLVPNSERNAGEVRAELEGDQHLLFHRQPESAVGLGQRQAEEAQLAHLGDDLRRNRVLVGQPLFVGHEPLAHEAPDAREQELEGLAVADHGGKSSADFAGDRQCETIAVGRSSAIRAMSDEDGSMHGDVAVIRLDNPPVNGLGHALRSAIVAGVDAANADIAVRAIVIAGAGKLFSAGADVREFGTPKSAAEPTLGTVIRIVESSAKPVVAAIHGTCMGGGLELALGCHHRVASRDAQVALPEVKLGLIPGAGGTQRLPRAIGVERALNMIVSGATVDAAALDDTMLFDELVDGDPFDAAIALARRVAGTGGSPKRLRDIAATHPDAEAFFQVRAHERRGGGEEPAGAGSLRRRGRRVGVDAVRRRRALRAPHVPGIDGIARISRAASRVLRGARGGPNRGCPRVDVRAPDRTGRGGRRGNDGRRHRDDVRRRGAAGRARRTRTVRRWRAASRRSARATKVAARKGRLTGAEVERRVARVVPTLSLDDIATADLVIEAVFEDMTVKREVFAGIDRVAKPGAILATNTSTLDVDAPRAIDVAAAGRAGPALLQPGQRDEAPGGRARRGDVARDVLATAMKLAKRIGKTAVVSGVCDGFIGNRMIEHYLRQAMFLVEEGASPAEVDAALERFGMAMGPFRMSDLAGLDVGWRIRLRRYVEQPHGAVVAHRRPPVRAGPVRAEDRRRLVPIRAGPARRAGGSRGRRADRRVSRGARPRARRIGDDEIVDRAILALVNEGARILDDGIAQRASDIDVVYLSGLRVPAPPRRADAATRTRSASTSSRDACASSPRARAADRAFWTPAPRLERLAAEGRTFNG